MTTYREKFLGLLRDDILKMDLAELDFGIYRILKYRRAELEQFLETRLPQQIAAAIGQHGQLRLDDLRTNLLDLRTRLNQGAQALGLASAFDEDGNLVATMAGTPLGKDYTKRNEELSHLEAVAGFTQTEEENLYNHLYTFFQRYYRGGDFEPQMRRSASATFAVPYQGEDVHFYWRDYGSHYVKTAEELRSYQYRDPKSEWTVRFVLVEASVEKDNVKGRTRYFFPIADQSHVLEQSSTTYVVPFQFRPPTEAESKAYAEQDEAFQDQILSDAVRKLRTTLPKNLDTEKLKYHMRRYARKHRSDYFVHPRVGKFLTDELEWYLKTEYLQPGSFTDPVALSDRFVKYRALRQIGLEIIALIDRIESFQAQLFEKRKFVTGTGYLIPVRFLPKDLWPAVIQNETQVQQWRDLFSLTGEVSETTLATHPTLVVDTRHFTPDFALRALAQFDDLDDATDAILCNAENYAALRTLEPLFRGQVTVSYIDPPYNTGSDGFLYRDDFSRHSTWLAMMAERLAAALQWLHPEEGVIFVSIDDNEYANLKELADQVFGPDNFVANVIWQKIFSPKNTAMYFSEDHDYLLVYARKKEDWRPYLLPRSQSADARYRNPDNDPRGDWASSDLTARNYYGEGQYEVESPGGRTFRPALGTYWRVSKKKFAALDADKRIWWGSDGNNMPRLKRFQTEVKPGIVPQTLWKHEDVGNTQEAKKELLAVVTFARTEDVLNTVKPTRLIHRVLHIGTTPEVPAWVLDFFAGSGTTGHAVISLNRQDGGQRRFVLIEMGEYFDQITYQRVIRTMYTPDWREGRPEKEPAFDAAQDKSALPDWVKRSPRLVKVLQLESYEDSLDALELPEERIQRLAGQVSLFENELHYCFEDTSSETLVTLSLGALEHPFGYELPDHRPDQVRSDNKQTQKIDLIETANLLLGLRVKRLHEKDYQGRRYVIVEARQNGNRVLVVWRDIAGLDPAQERTLLQQDFDLDSYDVIYANADSAISKGPVSLDVELKRQMLSRDPRAIS